MAVKCGKMGWLNVHDRAPDKCKTCGEGDKDNTLGAWVLMVHIACCGALRGCREVSQEAWGVQG